ncbi:MAG TPA: efflux RND transporter periplasmic adaptor subunit [Opitutaceae bacterium]|nr:efflux RND transporter periplasmic adaptor subunit [Opitutaceae bacterium]
MSDSPSLSPRRRWPLYGVVALAIAGAVWYFASPGSRFRNRSVQPAWAGTGWPPPIPVRTVAAKRADLPLHLKAIGTVTPLATVTVRSRVAGPVLRVDFTEGQHVNQGQLLAEIDPEPYRIALEQAEGQLQQSAAQLQTARTDLIRIRDLHAKGLVTDQELGAQQSLVSQYEGTQTMNQARVDTARLQLAWTRIEAPLAGRTGMRRIDPGNLVVANDTNGLVVITQTRPISVSFTIPEVSLPAVLAAYRAGRTIPVEIRDRDETSVLATGTLKTIDNQIDTTTGTLRMRAEFPNDDERLFPNEFVNVRMQVGSLDQAIVIPAAAVQFGSRGTYVYVVNAQSKAMVRDVVLGPADGGEQAITKGLEAGDLVVLEGLDRLREGRRVLVVKEASPAGSAATIAGP